MTRIGFDARFITSTATGLGSYTRSLLKALVKQESRFEFCLFTPDRASLDIFETNENVRIYEVPRSKRFKGRRIASISYEQLSLPASMLMEELDMVHYPYYVEPLLTVPPYIVSILDMDTFLPSDRHSGWTRAYHNGLIRLHARRSAAIMTISEYSRAQIVDYLQVPEEKVHVIYCGLGEAFAGVPGHEGKAPADLPVTGDYLLYAGGLGMRKNLRRMVDAFALARGATGSDTSLVITGGLAEVGQALKRYTDTAGYSDFIEFTGHVPDDQLPALYHGALASIYPSLNEGFGLPVIESMACGTPVITSRASAMEEISGGRAVLVDPLDVNDIAAAIGALISDRRLAAAYGALGPAQAAAYSWDKAAEECLELYEAVLSSGKVHC